MEKRRGSRIDRIPIKGGTGLLFAIAVLVIFLIEVPATRWFLLLALPVGVLIALALRAWEKWRK